jgi:hypothetical protein
LQAAGFADTFGGTGQYATLENTVNRFLLFPVQQQNFKEIIFIRKHLPVFNSKLQTNLN